MTAKVTEDRQLVRKTEGNPESSGFSLHAGIAAKASQRDKIERRRRAIA